MPTWNPRANELFLHALELSAPGARQEYLDAACAGDAALRAEVEALIDASTRAGSFLESPAVHRGGDDAGDGGCVSKTVGPLSADAADSLPFLAPSDKPGALGRLGHYEVLDVIGRGGMGVVLRAFDERLHRVVAIKVMAAQLATSATARQRFTREARAAAAVTHDNVVTIHAVEETDGLPYLVMQYVDGASLQERLDRSGPLQLHEVLRIGAQTAAGLAAAHQQGLVHRDIKPANILLENGVERVKLTDFGLARAAADASLTQSGAVAGTPQYMSPEQARGQAVDQRTDLFSLGSVLYALCTGRAPFRAGNGMAVLKRVCEEAPTPIREANPEIPDWLAAIVDRLHAKDPAERFQSAAEVAEMLGQHLAHVQHPSVAPQPAPLPPPAPGRAAAGGVSRAGGRWRRWAAVAALLVLCAVGALGASDAAGVTNFRATVVRLLTGDGTLVVEVNDPGVKVSVEGDGGLVITGAGPHEVRLRPGSYKLQAAKDGKPVPLDQDLVTITRGGKQVVRVAMESKGTAEPARPAFVTPWSDWDDWVVEGQELVQPVDSPSSHHLLFGDPNWTDYNFEVEVKITGAGEDVGLIFRAIGPMRRLNACLLPAMKGVREKGERAIIAATGNEYHFYALSVVPGETTNGRWYRMRVEARGNRFKMLVDDKLITSVYNEDFPRGCVGLFTATASARFRNLKVTDPSGKVLLEGLLGILPKPKGEARSHFHLGESYARAGQWAKASAAHDRGLKLDPSDHSRWCQAGVLHLAAGDFDDYRRICRELVRRFGDTDQALIAERAAKVCLLLPEAVGGADSDRMQKLSERAVTGTEKSGFYHYFARTKGLAEYRAGRYAAAIKWLERLVPNADGGRLDAETFAILAMAHHRLGHAEEAEAALAKEKAIVAKLPDPAQGLAEDWFGWEISLTVCREAEELLKAEEGAGVRGQGRKRPGS